MKSILFGEERRNFLTDPIHFQFTATDSIDKELRIILSHKYHKEYLYLQSNEQFNTTCHIGNYTLESYTCTDTGYVIDHICKGYYEELSSMCPPNIERAVCMLIENSAIHSCATLTFDSISTTCSCIYKYNINGLIKRKLEVTDLNNNDISGLDIVSISEFYTGDFLGTKTTAITDIISENEANNSKVILLSLSVLWIGMIFIVILFNRYQERINKKKLNNKISNNTSNNKNTSNGINPVVIKDYLRVYINSIIPDVFAPTSIWKRLTNEVSNNHRYIKIFSSSHNISDFERFMTSIQLLTLQTVIVFLLTSFYNLQSSDDNSCHFLVTERNCLKQVTLFDNQQSYCKWEHEYNSCLYNADISISLYPILNIGVIVILLVPFINYILDLLFVVASRPLLEKNERMNLVVPVDETKMNNIESKISSKTTLRKLTDIIHKSHSNAQLSYHYINYNCDYIASKRSEIIEKILNDNNYPFICHHEDKNDNDDNSFINQDIHIIDYDILCNNIYHQRTTLNQNEIEDFDLQWNSFFNGSNHRTKSYFLDDFFNNLFTRKIHKSRIAKTITSQSYIINRLDNVAKEVNKTIDKLNNSSQKEIGFEILYIFITDLLGRNTFESKIFQNKIENDFKNIKKVSKFHQRLSWFCILLINILSAYYSIQLGYYINSTWQMILFLSCFIHFFIEIFILEMIESFWINFIIPSFARKDIRNINKLLNEVIDAICDIEIEKKTVKYFLNSPSFFYVSTNIARIFPDLIESKLVRSYYYHLPLDDSISINKQQNKLEINNNQETSTMLTIIIMKLVDKSIYFQRFFIRFFYSFIFISIIYVTHFMLYLEPMQKDFIMLLWLYVVLLLLMLTFTIYKCYCFYSNESSIIKLESKEKLESIQSINTRFIKFNKKGQKIIINQDDIKRKNDDEFKSNKQNSIEVNMILNDDESKETPDTEVGSIHSSNPYINSNLEINQSITKSSNDSKKGGSTSSDYSYVSSDDSEDLEYQNYLKSIPKQELFDIILQRTTPTKKVSNIISPVTLKISNVKQTKYTDKSCNVNETKAITPASKSTFLSLKSVSSFVKTSNLLSRRTNIIQPKKESSSKIESSSESDEDIDEYLKLKTIYSNSSFSSLKSSSINETKSMIESSSESEKDIDEYLKLKTISSNSSFSYLKSSIVNETKSMIESDEDSDDDSVEFLKLNSIFSK
jgi:hypothetical protein